MRFNLDKAMGIHETALYVRARRSATLSSNLANSDTPNYKARDIDFRQVLKNADARSSGGAIRTTNAKYRQPFQTSIDGNTVDAQMEKAKFAENSMQYQSSLSFLTGKIKAITSAIKGE